MNPVKCFKNYSRAVPLLFLFIYTACSDAKSPGFTDTAKTGQINISVDESFKPVIDEQVKVFESSYPGAKIITHYKPEAACLKDLFKDTSNRMAILTRGLSSEEEKYFKDTLGYVPEWGLLAADAIVVLVNSRSNDTLFTIDDLKQRLSGRSVNKNPIIFDGLSATATIRFAVDSILRGEKFDTNVVKAVPNSRAVIDYVAENENAVGLVGISWIGNPEDTTQVRLLNKVKMAWVRCDTCAGTPYNKPNQVTIAGKIYPLVRGLYYILKENFQGLGSGFKGFMKYERGQLIFRRAYLQPEKMNFDKRAVSIN
jgi:phosphate transport system substrate-binding protein